MNVVYDRVRETNSPGDRVRPVTEEKVRSRQEKSSVEGPSARQYAGTSGPGGRVMSARQHVRPMGCCPGVTSARQGISTPARKHELARQYAERLPAHRIRQTLCGGPPGTQARPPYFKMSFELQVSQASSTEAILGLGGMLDNDDNQEVGLRIQLCASMFRDGISGPRRAIDRSDQVT